MTSKNPDFIGIGASKAASSWIFECLKEHPEICMSSKKEISFFNKKSNYKRGIEYYQSFFSHCPKDKIKGEFTPNYLSDPNTASLIHKHYPKIKLIVCLRNPIEKVYSHYIFHKKVKERFSIYNSFEEAIEKDPVLVKLGFYYEQLKRFFEFFPNENIIILFYEEIKRDPRLFIKKLYKFIGVNKIDFIPSCIYEKMNISGEYVVKPKIPYFNFLIFKFRNFIERKNWLKNLFDKTYIEAIIIKFLNFNKKETKVNEKESRDSIPPLNPYTRNKLIKIFLQDIEKLEQLLNKDLSSWKKVK